MLTPTPDVLIVDDNPNNLDLLAGLLKEQGCRVRAAPSGKMAIKAAEASPPELVLMDISMPEMDGYEACAALKAHPALSKIPVIFVSALDDPLDKVKAFHAGGSDYIPKPFQIEEVVARVEHHIRFSRLQREIESQNTKLLDANLKLKEINDIKADMNAMLVHDLKTPLTFWQSMLDCLSESQPVPADVIKASIQSIEKVNTLLSEMLEVFHFESGDVLFESVPVIPKELVRSVVEAHAHLATQKGVRVEWSIHGEPRPIQGDPIKLERALSNLLGNAIKFTPRGGRITVEAATETGVGVDAGLQWTTFKVVDSGPGIPPEDLPYIFDAYRHARRRSAGEGVGLGLAIVQNIVATHKGRMLAQSQLNLGSSFTIKLPC